MRIILFTALLLSCFTLSAQTSVIRLKSSHGELAEIPNSIDRYGNPPINYPNSPLYMEAKTMYDTLELLNGTCVIQKGWSLIETNRIVDTLCDDAFESEQKFIKEYYREIYGDGITFIGFEEDHSNIKYQNSPFFNKRTQKGSGKWIFIVIILSGLGTYLLRPTFKRTS